MRLINTVSLTLEEFFETKIPKYAILSHTWAEGEISYKDFVKKRNLDAAGWTKIRNCCKFAHNRGHNYVWIDTCCIDKRSSAELSEAINSMFHWYRQAQECYAYLSDVSYSNGFEYEEENGSEDESEVENEEKGEVKNEYDGRIQLDGELKDPHEPELIIINREKHHQLPEHVERAFCVSKWFTRGWTLQELLAPDHVYFIDQSWAKVLGDKISIFVLIAKITRIDEHVLLDYFRPEPIRSLGYSVAKRMSWASHRVCTRGEDVAYSLMGIFKVSMPLLYGEGKAAAFRRLQLEIIKNSTDESIFAWIRHEDSPALSGWMECGGILARSPYDFRFSANIEPLSPKQWATRQPYYQTNRGLAFQTVLGKLTLSEINGDPYTDAFLVPLRCWDAMHQIKHFAIVVKRLGPQDYTE